MLTLAAASFVRSASALHVAPEQSSGRGRPRLQRSAWGLADFGFNDVRSGALAFGNHFLDHALDTAQCESNSPLAQRNLGETRRNGRVELGLAGPKIFDAGRRPSDNPLHFCSPSINTGQSHGVSRRKLCSICSMSMVI